jgi:sugar phosphate isomerase/epimerase
VGLLSWKTTVKLATCIWALGAATQGTLQAVAQLGFKWIDVQPHMVSDEEERRVYLASGLKVSCIAGSFGLPIGVSLDAENGATRRIAIKHVERAIQHAASLGAEALYVVPPAVGPNDSIRRYSQSLDQLATFAHDKGISLCIEHFPGLALPTAERTIKLIRSVGHPALKLLFDIGHAMLSNEEPERVIEEAGSDLGYVHLDDNDGKGDLHLPLLQGKLTEDTLVRTFEALARISYDGFLSLELNPTQPEVEVGLSRSREIVLRIAWEHLE